MITCVRTTQYNIRVAFFIAILLSIFFACVDVDVDDTGGESHDPLRLFDEWIADNKANNLAFTTTGNAIATRTALEQMTIDGKYILTANIDLGGEDWTPLFSRRKPFTGTLHGNGYIIYNLNIDAPDANYQGLFAALSGASIKNLGIGLGSIHANAAAGALAGYARNGIVESDLTNVDLDIENIIVVGMAPDSHITVDGTVNIRDVDASYAGAVLGYFLSGNANTLINEGIMVKATGTTGKHGMVGGLVGYSVGTISNGRSNSAVSTNSGNFVGGLVGRNHGSVCGSTSGDVSANSGFYVGGVAGFNGGVVHGSASGDVSTNSGDFVGGLVGSTGVNASAAYHSYGSAGGDVSTNSGSFVGGLVGRNYGIVYGSASGNITTQSGQLIGGLVGSNVAGIVHGAASGMINSDSGDSIGGLIGRTIVAAVVGYSTGWVMVANDNTQHFIGAVVGWNRDPNNPFIAAEGSFYYHSAGGDHVGSIDAAPARNVNMGYADDTGTRGNNRIGIGIDDIANATAKNMHRFTVGTEEGEWTFTAGEWPKINLPEGVTDYMDYTTSPSQPENFID